MLPFCAVCSVNLKRLPAIGWESIDPRAKWFAFFVIWAFLKYFPYGLGALFRQPSFLSLFSQLVCRAVPKSNYSLPDL